MAILGILDEHEVHGYELKKQMAELAGGQGGVSFGSLYPALNRLERAGFVHTVDPAKPKLASPFTGPMTGAITGELAALRQRRKAESAAERRTGKRNRKVYAITATGRDRLRELLLTVDPTDGRAFSLQVAFCRHVSAAHRLELFERRRAHLTSELASRVAQGRQAAADRDPYLRSLREHDTHTLNRDLEWVDELIAITRDELSRPTTERAAVPSTTGGSLP